MPFAAWSGCVLIAAALTVGGPAPAVLEGVGVDGKHASVPLSGQVTIVDFFATWCKPCREALTDYPALVARFGDRVRLIVVDVEEPPAVAKAYFAKNPLPAEVALLVDVHGEAATAFGAGSFPSFYVIDKDGVVRHMQRGWGRGSAEALAESAGRLVGATSPAKGRGPRPDAGSSDPRPGPGK